MTDPEYVHYVMIIDRSGSMFSIKDDTQGGISAFIDAQLVGGSWNRSTVSFYQFDNVSEKLHDFELIEKVREYRLHPRGRTALLDACGLAITEVGGKLAAMPEDARPGHVMVLIATDGYENASKIFTRSEIKNMIEHQQTVYGWQFTYIGADQNAFCEATSMGIDTRSTLRYHATGQSVNSAWNVAAAAVATAAAGDATGIYYTQEQRDSVTGEPAGS